MCLLIRAGRIVIASGFETDDDAHITFVFFFFHFTCIYLHTYEHTRYSNDAINWKSLQHISLDKHVFKRRFDYTVCYICDPRGEYFDKNERDDVYVSKPYARGLRCTLIYILFYTDKKTPPEIFCHIGWSC